MKDLLNKFRIILLILNFIFILLITGIFIFSYAGHLIDKKINYISLDREWKYSFYQNDQLVETQTISLPFDISGYIENQKGIVVLEKNVNLSNFENPGIRLGMLGDGIEVYLDDLLISEYGKKNNIIFSAFNFDKTVPLLKYKKDSDDYQLKIMIYILTNTSIRQPFYIGEYEELNFKSNIVNFFNVKVKRFLFLIIFTILIIFIYLSIKEKRKDLLYFCLSSFFILIFSLNQLVEYLPLNYITFNYLFVYKSMHFMNIFFLISFFYLVNEKMNNLVKIIIILFSLFFFLDTILLANYNIRRKLYTYELFVGILSFVYLTFYVYLQYFYYKKLKFKKYLLPFTILFLTIVNDMLVFLLPSKYPQYYIIIFGFEIYIIIISRLIFNDLIATYLETDSKNKEIEKTNEKLKGYLNNISLSLKFIQKNKLLFEESSKTLTEKSKTTKSEIVLLENNVKDLNNIINKIHDIDANIMDLSDQEIKIGNKLRNLIELNSSNFIYMKENLSITKEFSTQIEEISRQTSLLALNASIEASKSSEYSKNFAVVAAEVKNLASKSSELVNKIKDIADDISIHADLGLESTNLLSNYFEDFYFNFQAFMEILQNNKKIYKDIEDIFNEISSSINMISQTIDNLNSYADELKRQII